MPEDSSDHESASKLHAADGLRLMRLFHTLTDKEDRDELIRLVETFVQSVRNRGSK